MTIEPDQPTAEARSVSVEREISATPSAIFALLNDPAGHVLLDGSGSVRKSRPGNPLEMRLGSRFHMDMRMGVPYRMWNTIVEWEQDRKIAWQQGWGHHIWRYELAPSGAGTKVRETFDWGPARTKFVLRLIRAPQRNIVAMRATLDRIQAHFEAQ